MLRNVERASKSVVILFFNKKQTDKLDEEFMKRILAFGDSFAIESLGDIHAEITHLMLFW